MDGSSAQLAVGAVNVTMPSLAEIATKEHLQRTYVGRILPLAFLAPDITRAIVDGCQPPSMTIDRLREPIPMDWNEQRVMFGFPAR
jgi:hypothetical protein